MASDPHRQNLAYPAYDRTGVGAAVNGDTIYVAQLFANGVGPEPRSEPLGTAPPPPDRQP
jgi:hypothetical protein